MVNEPNDTILVVDDEEPVRKTFREWLDGARLGCRILSAADAETALKLANENVIDLAILDWALGAGDDGLQLLQDLSEFNPDVVAIMITGYANKATPLDAMRVGVRDYLDKNQDLNRDSFLHSVRKQLERLRPIKRERQLHQSLKAFREAVEKIVPLVQSAAALNDPVPLPDAIGGFLQFLQQVTHAGDAVLLVRRYDVSQNPPEQCVAYDARGERLEVALAPFQRSIAGSVVSMQAPSVLRELEQSSTVQLQPFERGRKSLLAAPLPVSSHVQAVIELFDNRDGSFSPQDQRLLQAAAVFGTDLLRRALAQRQMSEVLLDTVAAALGASDNVAQSLVSGSGNDDSPRTSTAVGMEQPPPLSVLDQLREGLRATGASTADGVDTLQLAEAIRVLALRHGAPAIQHCTRLVESLRQLLDSAAGA